MSNIIQQMDEAVSKYALLDHPFYQAWNEGTLPVPSLQLYAWEYRRFISKIAEGWDACGFTDIANVEREHYDLWVDFAKSVHTEQITKEVSEVSQLVDVCEQSNASAAGAIGSLYAFETQQPYTAQSKLKGLKDHYSAVEADETYFEVHLDDFDEPEMLRKRILDMSEEDQAQALATCTETAKGLWDALTGIHQMQMN